MNGMLTKTGKLILCAVIVWILGSGAGIAKDAGDAIKVTARVDRTTVGLFERIALEIIVEGPARSLPAPAGLQLEGLKIVAGPQSSTQVQMANGSWSSRLSHVYELRAEKEGTWTIPPVTVAFQGRTYQSNPIAVVVKPPDTQAAQPGIESDSGIPNDRLTDLFVWATVSNMEPFVGQPLEIVYELYTRVKVVNYEIERIPEFSGFISEEYPVPERPAVTNKRLNNLDYATAVVHRVTLYPTVPGEVTLEPFAMKFAVEVRGKDPMDEFFNSPFGPMGRNSFFSQHQQEIRQSQALRIQVKSLPSEGKPDTFSGAVGQFELSGSLDKSVAQVGEAIIMKATLTGNHGLKMLTIPPGPTLPQFKCYEPKAGDVLSNPGKPGWSMRTFEYILVPFESGQFEIPGIEFSYFDPETGLYQTLRNEPSSVTVNPGPGGDGITLMTHDGGGEIKLLGKDIRYIKTGTRINSYIEPYRTGWFWGSIAFPIPLIPVALMIGRHRRKLLEDDGYARSVRARGESTKRLAKARSLLNDSTIRECLDELAAAFRGYLSDRFNRTPASISVSVIQDELQKHGFDAARIEQVTSLWETLESARFSPAVSGSAEIGTMIENVSVQLDALETVRWRSRRVIRKREGTRS